MIENKFYVIDLHCHIYPDKIAQKAVAGTDTFYGQKSFGMGTTADLCSRGEECGVDHFVVHSVATKPAQTVVINDFIAGEVLKYNGKLTGFGALHPDSENLEADLDHLLSLGLKGVKLHPDIQQIKVDDPRNLRIYDLCEKKGVPVLLHTGDRRYDFSNPNRVYPVALAYPNLTFIGAHFGGWSVWEKVDEKLCGLPNFYVDCSSSSQFLTPEKIKDLICLYGTDKVMFGTDYPMWNSKTEIEYLLNLGFSDEDYHKIFSGNAKKLLNLD